MPNRFLTPAEFAAAYYGDIKEKGARMAAQAGFPDDADVAAAFSILLAAQANPLLDTAAAEDMLRSKGLMGEDDAGQSREA